MGQAELQLILQILLAPGPTTAVGFIAFYFLRRRELRLSFEISVGDSSDGRRRSRK
jgi:hypothetical protein